MSRPFDKRPYPASFLDCGSQMIESYRLIEAHRKACRDLLDRRQQNGCWTGRLASSALSTATAVSALSCLRSATQSASQQEYYDEIIQNGIGWLADQQNADGGFADTDLSHSNISTSMLVAAAFHLSGCQSRHSDLLQEVDGYIQRQGGIPALKGRYGRDKTFAVPILTNCALAQRVSWSQVSALPFELACFPQSFYRFLRLPVVSYAIPALVAIGQTVYHHRKPWNPLVRFLRRMCIQPSLDVLDRIQPESGGYLEAIPLTSFVVMSLAACGRHEHPVVQNGAKFLIDSVREDGSWPIDTNLATWNTTLSINSLSKVEGYSSETAACLDWLLDCQNTTIHPFTGADPGGWGWSDLTGAVPDADDTPGALLALRNLFDSEPIDGGRKARIVNAATSGIQWLLGLQNRDGGWPTFCRGWGKLPFDRSGTDLTAHAIRALLAWSDFANSDDIKKAIRNGFDYLEHTQRQNGSWVPLWFGNQEEPDDENPIYGTSKVLLAFQAASRLENDAAQRAKNWLLENQNPDGGWGGSPHAAYQLESEVCSSVEETALALEALLAFGIKNIPEKQIDQGLRWLTRRVEFNEHHIASPIGFYFAKLWYYEELYPLIFTVSALGEAARQLATTTTDSAATVQAI